MDSQNNVKKESPSKPQNGLNAEQAEGRPDLAKSELNKLYTVIIFCIVAIIGIVAFFVSIEEVEVDDHISEIQIAQSEVVYRVDQGGSFVLTIGTIQNKTEIKWTNVRFEIRYYDAK